ncbi:hypothetical protein J1614_004352 [Plenodomus biglobosus]|nr:hypothetical protein J1614_004352 [Plenodomus biglobosus]
MEALSSEQIAILEKEDLGPKTKAIVYSFTVVAFTCVCLRVFTRVKYVGRTIGWEDYTIIFSMLCSIITAVFQVLQFNAGGGRHSMFIPFPEGLVDILRNLYFSIIFYNVSLFFTKISILLQYERIFSVSDMRIPLRIVTAICVAYGIAVLFTSIFSCFPIRAYWHVLEKPNAHCLPSKILWYVHASFNILCDILVAGLPVRVIWKLQISKQQKIALIGILTIGWFVCIVSILRLHALTDLVANLDDTTYHGAAASYWSTIEMNMAILCASLPALKPLFVNIIPGFSSHKGSRGYGTSSGRRPSFVFGTLSCSRRSRHVAVNEVELESARTINTHVYPSESNTSVHGKNIYVSRQFEQHFEGDSHNSDNESQKELVDGQSQKGFVHDPVTVYAERSQHNVHLHEYWRIVSTIANGAWSLERLEFPKFTNLDMDKGSTSLAY